MYISNYFLLYMYEWNKWINYKVVIIWYRLVLSLIHNIIYAWIYGFRKTFPPDKNERWVHVGYKILILFTTGNEGNIWLVPWEESFFYLNNLVLHVYVKIPTTLIENIIQNNDNNNELAFTRRALLFTVGPMYLIIEYSGGLPRLHIHQSSNVFIPVENTVLITHSFIPWFCWWMVKMF